MRLVSHTLVALAVIFGSLLMGILGYHFTEGLPWLDSLVNASMILGGMGPVDALHTTAGKLFASFYALYSGMVFLVAVGSSLPRSSTASCTASTWNPEETTQRKVLNHRVPKLTTKAQRITKIFFFPFCDFGTLVPVLWGLWFSAQSQNNHV